jgi:hypothetical protein
MCWNNCAHAAAMHACRMRDYQRGKCGRVHAGRGVCRSGRGATRARSVGGAHVLRLVWGWLGQNGADDGSTANYPRWWIYVYWTNQPVAKQTDRACPRPAPRAPTASPLAQPRASRVGHGRSRTRPVFVWHQKLVNTGCVAEKKKAPSVGL